MQDGRVCSASWCVVPAHNHATMAGTCTGFIQLREGSFDNRIVVIDVTGKLRLTIKLLSAFASKSARSKFDVAIKSDRSRIIGKTLISGKARPRAGQMNRR